MATVLIIEDEEPIRNLLTRIIAREGHRVLSVADGDAGLATARDEKPDFVISDLTLPGDATGIPLVHALHRILPDAPIVIATGRSMPDDREELEATGVRHVLLKPFDLASVRNLIATLLPKG